MREVWHGRCPEDWKNSVSCVEMVASYSSLEVYGTLILSVVPDASTAMLDC